MLFSCVLHLLYFHFSGDSMSVVIRVVAGPGTDEIPRSTPRSCTFDHGGEAVGQFNRRSSRVYTNSCILRALHIVHQVVYTVVEVVDSSSPTIF